MTTQVLVQIAITSCPECSSSYDLDEWRALELRGESDVMKGETTMRFEERVCSGCEHVIKSRVDGLDDLDLFVDADAYADAYGPVRQHRAIVVGPGWWDAWRPTLTLIALVAVAAMLAALAVIGMVRALL